MFHHYQYQYNRLNFKRFYTISANFEYSNIMILKKSIRIAKISSNGLGANNHQYQFGKITQYVRMWLNRIRFEDNRALQDTHSENKILILQTPKEVQDKFIAHEQVKSVMEKERMARIDQILGTKTFYHQTKIFQQRLDSDHLMQIQDLKKKNPVPTRQQLNWQNPQAQPNFKVKNKRKFYKNMRNIRQYPKHTQKIKNIEDQKQQEVLDFLIKETLFTNLSLKSVELSSQSLQSETIKNLLLELESRRFTRSYAYFATQQSSSMFRVPQAKYTSDLITKLDKIVELNEFIEPIISLDQIYQVIKQYYHDERVSQYLKAVQNGSIQYVISGFLGSASEDKIVFWVDLLGTKQEYAYFYKSLKQNDGKLSKHVMFNCKNPAIFSASGKFLYFVRRSQEGGFIQLIQKQVTHFNSFEKQAEILFKCQAFQEMQITKDQNNNFVFVKINQIGSKYKEKIFVIDQRDDTVGLIDLNPQKIETIVKQNKSQTNQNAHQKGLLNTDNKKQFRSQVEICSKGLIIMKIYETKKQYLKYGANIQYSTKIQLIPYKEHIQIMQESNQRIGLQLPQSNKFQQLSKISVHELQFNKRVQIYECSSQQFIIEMSVRSSHILLNMSSKSIYNKTRLYVIPFSQASNPHSLILQAQRLSFLNFGYDYNNQIVYFKLKKNIIQSFYSYTIWKRQISQIKNDRVYQEEIEINENVKINVMCLDRYINIEKTRGQQFELPVVLWMDDGKTSNNQISMKRFLEKGIILISIDCRGTYTKDLIKLHRGTGQNYKNLIEDIEAVIQYVGNSFSSNISLYAKGNFISFIGLLLNIKHPFLFNSTVLHNGVYDLSDWSNMSKNQQFFGSFMSKQQFQKSINFWKHANPLNFRWKLPFRQNKEQEQLKKIFNQQEKQQKYLLSIGTIQNLVFSSDKQNRAHSRKMIYKLRKNPYFTYGDVYLKQHDIQSKVDLFNLSYLFMRILDKLHQDNVLDEFVERKQI